jgi:ribose-phosphate pyrophosphokinase
MSDPSPLLFTLSESRDLGEAISRESGISLAPLEERAFEQGEFKLRPMVSIRERTACVVQSLCGSNEAPTAQRFVRLLFLLCALRDAGARQTIALVPYLAYARKDRRTQTSDPIHTRYVAQLLEACGVNRIVALDVHNPAACDNAFRVGFDHLSALPMFAEHFAQRMPSAAVAIASPDVGGIKRAQIFRELLQQRLGRPVAQAFVEKRRVGGEVSGGLVVGDIAGSTVLVLDDLCSTGGTLRRAAASLRAAGATAVYAVVTHAPLDSGTAAVLGDPAVDGMVVTDSVGANSHPLLRSPPPKLTVLPIAPLLGQALSRPLRGLPLAELLEHWPPRVS